METISLGPVSVDRNALAEVCRKWGIRSVALFGSALRDDFTAESDIDLLLEYFPDSKVSLFDYGYMNEDFQRIFGREVDLVQAEGLRTSRNYIRREDIFSSAKQFYVANS
jgi:predicted nucleotidyltransferase